MKHENEESETAEASVLMLLETAARVERRLDLALSSIRGISFSEYRLLRALDRTPSGSATRVDLAAAVGLTPSAVTRALKPLEKLGIVVTQKSDRDARRSLASLTSAGLDLLADARGVVADVTALLPLDRLESGGLAAFRDGLARRRDA